MRDTFSRYHPLVNFLYFTFIFVFSMFFMHPFCLLISFLGSIAYFIELEGFSSFRKKLILIIPVLLVTAIINPAFNHEGATIITYFRTGNPLTLESITYGIAAATMLVSVLMWFASYNIIMTSDKFVYLFGRIIPSLSLILSMALRFVPRFKNQIKIVSNAQKCIGRDVSNGSMFQRTKHAITIISIMITWSLENAIETSDSMRSRGYGLEGRTSFSIYEFENRDKIALIGIMFLGIYVLVGGLLGGFKWRYFPSMKGVALDIYPISLWLSYILLCLVPIIANRREEKQWQNTQLED